MFGEFALRRLMLGQHFARASDHFVGQSSQFCDFDTVAAIRGSGFDFAQKDNTASGFLHRNVIVLYSRKLLSQLSQFEIVSGEESLGANTRVQIFDGGPRNREAVISGCAAAYLV